MEVGFALKSLIINSMMNFFSASFNCFVDLIENPIISGCPNAPGHEDNNLHEKGNTQEFPHPVEDLRSRPCGGDSNANRSPTCFSEVAS
jgi:hypothetical protein